MTAQQPGDEIAGYRIESLIGRGGMAVVYRAEDIRLGRKVALKLLAPQLADSEQFRQRFIRESRLAASLDHPNIVPIYEAGDADGQLFIAMRYVLGRDLRGLLTEQAGRLPLEWTPGLFDQIAEALDAAHRAGLVHRDVKPGNILIATREQREHAHRDHVYLTDFGLTKRAAELSGGLTGTGHFLGTVDYVAPEQIQGKPVGPRADIYALGCVLYECLTGQLPFRRDDDAALLWAHLVEAPVAVTAIRPEIPERMNVVVARAMAKDPAERYGSCEELVREIEVALDAPAPVSSPDTRPAGRGGPVPDGVSSSGITWAESGTVTGDSPTGAPHPSFPSGLVPHFPSPPGAPRRNAPPADDALGVGSASGFAQEEPAQGHASGEEEQRYDWDPGGWDRGDWDQGDGYPGDGGPGASEAPAARPLWRRHWRLVALVAVAVVLLAVGAVVLRSVLSPGGYRTYTSRETVVPFRLDHPADWGSTVSAASDIVLGPDPTAGDDLLFGKGDPQAWATTTGTVQSGSPSSVWLYVYASASTYDRSALQTLQESIALVLPRTTQFEPVHRETTVSGSPADEMEAVTFDPQHPQTRLRVLLDVVQPPGASGAVLLAFFAPPDRFEQQRPVFEKIRDSLTILR